MIGQRRAFWLVLAAAAVVWLAMALGPLAKLNGLSGGRKAFDLRAFGYDLPEVADYLAAIGPEGRAIYTGLQQPLDMVFPALVALLLCIAARELTGGRLALLFGGFALLGAGIDYLENMLLRAIILAGPDGLTAAAVGAASRATIAKFLCDGIAVGGVLAAVLSRLARPER